MTPEQFCYWLQGYVEISGQLPSPEEWETIKDHLSLVFTKVTPDRKKTPQQILQEEIDRARISQPGVRCGDGKIC